MIDNIIDLQGNNLDKDMSNIELLLYGSKDLSLESTNELFSFHVFYRHLLQKVTDLTNNILYPVAHRSIY